MKKIYSIMVICVAVLTSVLFVSCERDILPTETVLSVIDEEVTPSYTSCKITCSFYTDATIEYASVQYSATDDFARYDVTKMTKNTDNGSYSVELTQLQANTIYYFRYEVNACVCTSSKADKVSEFQTLTSSVPVVTTTSATDISDTYATVGGVLYDAGFAITECGIVYSTSEPPTIANSKVKSYSRDDDGLFSCKLTGLSAGNTYYARAYVVSEKGTGYGKVIKFTPGVENGHGYVDLGLSVKWATCNVGAIDPEDYGSYLAWGEILPKGNYAWNIYKWCEGDYYNQTKYCFSSSYGVVDNKNQLELSDDVARANWGGNWRMPTDVELAELLTKCTWELTAENGVYGCKVTSKQLGYTEKSIFIPSAGLRDDISHHYAGEYGYYWSSSLYMSDSRSAYFLYFGSNGVGRYANLRYLGLPVRPVRP